MPKDYFIRPSVQAVQFDGDNFGEIVDFAGSEIVVSIKFNYGDFIIKMTPTYNHPEPRFIVVPENTFHAIYQEGK